MSQDCDLINGLAVDKSQETRCPVCFFSFSSGIFSEFPFLLYFFHIYNNLQMQRYQPIYTIWFPIRYIIFLSWHVIIAQKPFPDVLALLIICMRSIVLYVFLIWNYLTFFRKLFFLPKDDLSLYLGIKTPSWFITLSWKHDKYQTSWEDFGFYLLVKNWSDWTADKLTKDQVIKWLVSFAFYLICSMLVFSRLRANLIELLKISLSLCSFILRIH